MAIRRDRRRQGRELEKSKQYVVALVDLIGDLNKTDMSQEDKNDTIRASYLLVSLEFTKYKTITLDPYWLKDVIKDGESKRVLIKSLI